MKKFLFLLIVPLLLLGVSSCGTTASVTGGLNDESYIVIASSGKYLGQKVEVLIDEVSAVSIVPVKPEHVTRSAKRITITPGRHQIVVRDRAGNILFAKEIFVSTRTAKTITLR
ncbi:hypothetical protein [uncultured Porphyromonas sp.]|uniref:hypothetical protein n=1 Tax=uncultured Porphyromonas sp. TaxID=159274 RepID=UPI00261D8F42|nr:hypothetical protein [uncultured Porphyromonas sp.]